ncbi:hypothetical protein [Halostagnicola bangensis]
MSDAPEFSDEFVENFLNHVFELWFDDALEEKDLERADFRKGQVFLTSPFALSQFEDLSSEDSDVEVRVNDDAEVKMMAQLKEGESVEAGDQIYANQIKGFEGVALDEEQEDYGHVTVARNDAFGWIISFNFRKNRSYYEPLLEATDQFIETAEYAKENKLWRAFVENAFHSAERMMKIDVIFIGWKAERHGDVQARYSDLIQMDMGNKDLYNVFNQLKGKYRFSASYVDPRGDVDEREFDFSEEDADDFLETIKEHRDHLSDEL